MIDKRALPTKILWVDLEMTGLDPAKDVILEVAAEITDFDFTVLGGYEARVKHPRAVVAERMHLNTWWNGYPENRDQFLDHLNEGLSLGEVEQELVALVKAHFGDEPAILGGNSIHNDRNFIKQWWPQLDGKLHYRMLDVSALKVFMQGKYGVEFEKKDVHRALDDIQASIAELQYYLERLQKND
ncbi:MAG TPA: oligoribonuclease [Patescibacteria group bacterium]|nr:oligoribonuclease [Patescibacteria group bacterium]